jgi:urease accessory protein
MHINDTELGGALLLLQINDALFPIGSYTQSYGLETYVQKGIVHDAASTLVYLQSNIANSLSYNELLVAKLAYVAAKEQNWTQISRLDEYCSAFKAAKEIRQASNKLGTRFIKNVLALNHKSSLHNLLNDYAVAIERGECSGHFALAYGIFCSAMAIELSTALMHFLYGQVSGMVTNAVKLIPLSQTAGQQILFELHPEMGKALTQVMKLTWDDLGRSAPAFELRAMQHEVLYSRLYMS